MKRSPYAGFDPLSESDHWEDRDRALVHSRLRDIPPYRFFTSREAAVLTALVDRLLPQDDRAPRERIAIAPFLDQMLSEQETDGFRHEDMPWHAELWRRAISGIDQTAVMRHGQGFTDLSASDQDAVLRHVQSEEAAAVQWGGVVPAKAFRVILREAVSVYYAHPAAWAEIGWPGPASRRGYLRTGYGRRDPWEPVEQPADSAR